MNERDASESAARNLAAKRLCDRLAAAVAAERGAQVRQVELVAALCDTYVSVEGVALPGSERLVPSGADGTPLVAEFLAVELAPLLGVGFPTAWALIRDTMDLRHRHPQLWEAVRAERVAVWQARQVAGACSRAGLGPDAAVWVDDRLAADWGALAWPRVRRKLDGLIMMADRALAAERAARRRAERFVRVRHEGDGSSLVVARVDTADAVALADAVDVLARGQVALGRVEPLPVLRAEALGDLVRPTEGGMLPRPSATLVVHVARESLDSGGVARVEGEVGALLLAQVRDLLGHSRVKVLPVLDMAGDPATDAYEIPARIRAQVRVRDAFSVFPYSTVGSGVADLDHTRPYRFGADAPPGQTRPSNLGPLGRLEHRAKTWGGWQVAQTEPGVFAWTSPLGYQYRVAGGRTRRDPGQQPRVEFAWAVGAVRVSCG